MNLISVVSPLTGEKLHDIQAFSASEVADAFKSARKAQPAWAESAQHRSLVAKKLAALLAKEQSAVMDMLQAETGKSRSHAFEEVAGALGAISYYAKVGPKLMKRKRIKAAVPLMLSAYVETVPVGVVGVITPWNYPLALTMMDVIPALMAGNSVVHKADNQTAMTVHLARDLAIEAGVPEDVWQIVHGDPAEVGNAVTDNADYVAFTGSTPTGRMVAERAAKRLIGYSLELGGKNPMIVLPGANLEQAAEIALGSAFGNAGQLCVSIERLYVPNHALSDFEAILKRRIETMTAGITFAMTLLTAPRIYWGVMTGVLVGLSHFLHTRLHPRIIEVGLHPDGSLRDRHLWKLPPLAPQLYALRMDAELDFAAASDFDRAITDHLARHPDVKHVCLFAQPINRIDVTGVDTFGQLHRQLASRGMTLHISGIKLPVETTLRKAGELTDGQHLKLYRTDAEALQALKELDPLPADIAAAAI